MIRSLWIAVNLSVATIVLASAVVIAALLRIRKPALYDWTAHSWSRWILWASATPVYAEGLENIRLDSPQVVAANHQSWYDVFALAYLMPKRFRFIAKKELARIPIFGTAWQTAGHIAIDRSNRPAAIRSLEHAGRVIHEDNSAVVIFPEGTRSSTERMLPFKKGAFMLALHSGVDIVPAAVAGTRRILPKGGWRVRPGPIIVRFGKPIRAADFGTKRRDELIVLVRRRIAEMRSDLEPLRRAS